MRQIYITLAVAASLTAVATAHAQQQQFGRDSVYAVPGKSSRAPAPVVAAPVDRFGRDSVYVTQTPNVHSTPLSADAKSPQQYGRDSVFAYGSPNPPAGTGGETKVGSTGHGQGG
jgi:hypothetical protein